MQSSVVKSYMINKKVSLYNRGRCVVSAVSLYLSDSQFTITEKIVGCTFPQDALPMSIENY